MDDELMFGREPLEKTRESVLEETLDKIHTIIRNIRDVSVCTESFALDRSGEFDPVFGQAFKGIEAAKS